jgi:ABC-type antimicrobial peptide transport system permease subunit
MSKCRAHLEFLTQFMESTFPSIYYRIIEECDIDLAAVFTSTVITAFVGDLQSVFPDIATHIFDVFLCDGECLIFVLITKFISLQHDHMLDIVEDADFLKYIMY